MSRVVEIEAIRQIQFTIPNCFSVVALGKQMIHKDEFLSEIR
jgi:hypothetical protein